MYMRKILLLAMLVPFLAGCVVQVRPAVRHAPQYEEEQHDYRSNPSYMGYYYARIIFIQGLPYYVDDERHVRQIPSKLHSHFVSYPYDRINSPLAFSQDKEVRDGYRMSRIIYSGGTPFQVNDDRNAYPLPKRLHPRFAYKHSDQGKQPANDNRMHLQNRQENAQKNTLRTTGQPQKPITSPLFGRVQPDSMVAQEEKHDKSNYKQQLMKKQQAADLAAGKEQSGNATTPAKGNSEKRQDDKKKQRDRKKDKKHDQVESDEGNDDDSSHAEVDEAGDDKKKQRNRKKGKKRDQDESDEENDNDSSPAEVDEAGTDKKKPKQNDGRGIGRNRD